MTIMGIIIILVIWLVISFISLFATDTNDGKEFGINIILSPVLLIHLFFFYKYIWL